MEKSSDHKLIPMLSVDSGKTRSVSADVSYYTDQIVNLIMIGEPGGTWVMVDAGMPGSAKDILRLAADRYGEDNPPACILLTHGHFDHIGGLVDLLKVWDTPVYAHRDEFPFLTGRQAYPEPDVTVEGGLLAKLSFLYPHEPVNIIENLRELPADFSVPELPGWRWVHTPGHTPGQVAFFREADKLLLSADAFITVRQDSLYRVLVQKTEVCGPPVYLTTDWDAALDSVRRLAALEPETVISGHGTAMKGEKLRDGLQNLLQNWNELAVPGYGRWVTDKGE